MSDAAGVLTGRTVDALVIGEALVDIVVDRSGSAEHPGGSPANVAMGLGRRGVDVALLTDLGRDARGSLVVDHLERSNVHVIQESLSDRPTSSATATLAQDGSAAYRFDVRWQPPAGPLPVRARLVHTGSIASFLEPGRSSVLDHLDRLRAPLVTLDPNIRPALLGTQAEALLRFEELASRADIVKMSDEDAAWLYPRLTPVEVSRVVRELGPGLVVVTLGADGALLTTTDGEHAVPGVATTVADTIGAGDTFMASLIVDALAVSGGAAEPPRGSALDPALGPAAVADRVRGPVEGPARLLQVPRAHAAQRRAVRGVPRAVGPCEADERGEGAEGVGCSGCCDSLTRHARILLLGLGRRTSVRRRAHAVRGPGVRPLQGWPTRGLA